MLHWDRRKSPRWKETITVGNLEKPSQITCHLMGKDRLALRRQLNNWQFELEDLSLNEGQAINAAIRLVVLISDPAKVRELAEEQGLPAKDVEQTVQVHEWFMSKYMDILREVSTQRKDLDGRRNKATQD